MDIRLSVVCFILLIGFSGARKLSLNMNLSALKVIIVSCVVIVSSTYCVSVLVMGIDQSTGRKVLVPLSPGSYLGARRQRAKL